MWIAQSPPNERVSALCYIIPYCFAFRYPACSLCLCRRSRAPDASQARHRTGVWVYSRLHSRPAIFRMDSAGPLRFPGDPFLDFAAFSGPGTSVKRLTHIGDSGAAPMTDKHKGTLAPIPISGLNSAASSPPVYASRRALPNATQHSLPAGGLGLCRARVEPAESRLRVSAISGHRILPSRAFLTQYSFGRAAMASIAVPVEVTKTLATPALSGHRNDLWPRLSPGR